MPGEKLPFARNSHATNQKCPKCTVGLLRPTEDGLKCWSCGFIKPDERPVSRNSVQKESILTPWEKNQIIDALQEQYMRARGNVRRSKLESSRELLTIRADKLDALMQKVKDL